MSTSLPLLIEQFDALALRLRLMLTLALVIVVFMIFDVFWFSSNDQKIKSTQQTIQNSRQKITNLVKIQKEHNEKLFRDRSDPRNQHLDTLDAQLNNIRQQLTQHTLNLVKPDEMAKVLKKIILSSQSLRLEKLEKQLTVELSKPSKKDNTNTPNNEIKLYRHSMLIELKGSYQSAFTFLRKLENMERQVAFDSFEYVVDVHPKAFIKLTVSTLSLDKEWIGG